MNRALFGVVLLIGAGVSCFTFDGTSSDVEENIKKNYGSAPKNNNKTITTQPETQTLHNMTNSGPEDRILGTPGLQRPSGHINSLIYDAFGPPSNPTWQHSHEISDYDTEVSTDTYHPPESYLEIIFANSSFPKSKPVVSQTEIKKIFGSPPLEKTSTDTTEIIAAKNDTVTNFTEDYRILTASLLKSIWMNPTQKDNSTMDPSRPEGASGDLKQLNTTNEQRQENNGSNKDVLSSFVVMTVVGLSVFLSQK